MFNICKRRNIFISWKKETSTTWDGNLSKLNSLIRDDGYDDDKSIQEVQVI
jgi:hypothetical protein